MPEKIYDNHYALLGVPFDASEEEIRNAYHDLARSLHPDSNPSKDATEQFLKVQSAYEILSQPDLRSHYDQTLGTEASDAGIRTKMLLSRSEIIRSNEPQLLYAMVEISAAPLARQAAGPAVNVCLVIDRSTSMQGKRMDIVKMTARRILKKLRPGDMLSIVTFSDRSDVVVPPSRDLDPKKTEARISLIQTGGGTEIFSGLSQGYELVRRGFRASSTNHIILITDGHTYGDEERCLKLAGQMQGTGVTLSALGIGNEWNEEFLDRLASKTGGGSVYISNPRDIQSFLELKIDGLQQIYGENLLLDAGRLGSGVEIQYAFRVRPGPTRLESGEKIALGYLRLNEPLVLLLEILLSHSSEAGSQLQVLNGSIQCEIPARKVPASRARIAISLPVAQDNRPEAPPQPIIEAMSRLTMYRMQEQTRRDLANGNFDAATNRLRRLATRVLASGDTSLASTILKEAHRLETDSRRTQRLEKAVMYGTKTLISKTDR